MVDNTCLIEPKEIDYGNPVRISHIDYTADTRTTSVDVTIRFHLADTATVYIYIARAHLANVSTILPNFVTTNLTFAATAYIDVATRGDSSFIASTHIYIAIRFEFTKSATVAPEFCIATTTAAITATAATATCGWNLVFEVEEVEGCGHYGIVAATTNFTYRRMTAVLYIAITEITDGAMTAVFETAIAIVTNR